MLLLATLTASQSFASCNNAVCHSFDYSTSTSANSACYAHPTIQVTQDSNNTPIQLTISTVTKANKNAAGCTSTLTVWRPSYCEKKASTTCTQLLVLDSNNCTCASTAVSVLNSILLQIQKGTLSASDVNTTQDGTTIDSTANSTTISDANTIGSEIAALLSSSVYFQLTTGE